MAPLKHNLNPPPPLRPHFPLNVLRYYLYLAYYPLHSRHPKKSDSNRDRPKPIYGELAMDRVLSGRTGRDKRGSGQGGAPASGRAAGAHDRASGGSRRDQDKGYAAHAASPSSKKGGDGGGSGKESVGAKETKGGKDSPRSRDDFKEYALAVRKRDRRGRDGETAEAKEKGRSQRDVGRKEYVSRGVFCQFVAYYSEGGFWQWYP